MASCAFKVQAITTCWFLGEEEDEDDDDDVEGGTKRAAEDEDDDDDEVALSSRMPSKPPAEPKVTFLMMFLSWAGCGDQEAENRR